MIGFMTIIAALAVIMSWVFRTAASSGDQNQMATLCFDELKEIPYINLCWYKPEAPLAGSCNPLDHLFDGIDCSGDPDLKFGPRRITVNNPYTCYLFKANNCTGDYTQILGGAGEKDIDIDYWSLRCDSSGS